MITLILKNFLRSNSVKIGVLFLLLSGLISLFVGKQFIDKQQQSVAETIQYQQKHIANNVKNHQDEIGLLLYYLKFSLVNNSLPINALSIGQRDVNPSIKSVTIRTLEAQKYDSDLNNPYNLLVGNIDFSFVLIFLFPLIIIAFTYNIISEEKESGTWKIVLIQSQSPFKFVFQLFLVRFLVVILVLLVTLFLGLIILGIPFDGTFVTYFFVSILYILFWFCLCFWVASLHKSSNFNAVILLSIWIFLIIILPSSINNYLVNKYPTPEALETTLKQRKGYHEKWDLDKQATVDKFFKHYPQFSKFKMPEGDFNWLWYYAMQQMGDDESAKQSLDLREKLEKRNGVSANIAQFIPTLHLQIQLDEIAKSGLGNQLFFLDEMNKFHEKMRLYFYPKIFSEAPVNSENWESFKVQTFIDNSSLNYARIFLPLLGFVIFFLGLGWVNFKNKK